MKPDTYTQLYIHLVIAVKNRENLLNKQKREELFKYISGIIENKNCKSIIVNGYSDHVHALVGLHPAISLSELVRDVKRSSTHWVNSEKKWFPGKFSWQNGYGAFTFGKSQMAKVYDYIYNQEIHHSVKSFREEYLVILNKYDLNYKSEFLFEFYS